jgi:tetratricopeptide (TPR) repeat protein
VSTLNTPATAGAETAELSGRYRLISSIGRGGMGAVYRAFDRLGQREVAYKRLLTDQGHARGRRAALFQREYETLARLAHPGIVEVYDYGIDPSGPYYTMEFVSGRDLAQLTPLPVRDACVVLRDVASALALIHARGLIHRDLSPNNVRLTPDGRAKLIDFGALSPFGRASEVVGTPAFVAPECLRGAALDQRTDLYALGALLYLALTGKLAVRAHTFAELQDRWALDVVPPSRHLQSIPSALDELVLALLRHDPLARPTSAAEVIERLSVIADLPDEADERKVAHSYLAHPPLVGRDELMQQMEQLTRGALGGRGASVLLESQPGIGRTTILDSLAVQAMLAGATVLRESGGTHPSAYGAARELARAARAYTAADGARHSLPGSADAFAAPALEPARTPFEAAARRERLLSTLQQSLIDASAANPLVVLVDDVHLLDPESIVVLAALAERIAELPMLLVSSVAAGDAAKDPGALARLLELSERVTLPVLQREQIVELFRAVFGDAPNAQRVALWLHEQAGGNLSHSIDLARTLLNRRLVRYARGSFVLPHDIDEQTLGNQPTSSFLARLDGLSAASSTLCALLSVHEGAMTLPQLAVAVHESEHSVFLALGELLARGMVVLAGEEVHFAGASARRAVEASLPEAARRDMHLRVARGLLARRRDAESSILAARHLMQGGDELHGAQLLARVSGEEWFEGEVGAKHARLLEDALGVLQSAGWSDARCVSILTAICRSGFYGDYATQNRHLTRTLDVLSNLTGLTLATRLRPLLGAKLSLYVALLFAALRCSLTPHTRRMGGLRGALTGLLNVAGSSTAAACCAFDPETACAIAERLAPLGVLPDNAAPSVAYRFCKATAALGSGEFAVAAQGYEKLLDVLSRPVLGFDETLQRDHWLGCLHGMAQVEVINCHPKALELADRLSQAHPFYAPHAEDVRASYYAMRGEQDRGDVHARRAEMLAMRGGMSWSSVCVTSVHSLYAAVLTRNPAALARLVPEFERMAEIAPNMLLYRDICCAQLDLLRGRTQAAITRFEQVLAAPKAKTLPTRRADRGMYARALAADGQYERASALSRDVLEQLPAELTQFQVFIQTPLLILAESELALGELDGAAARVERRLAEIADTKNPLNLGALHQLRARIALRAGHIASFRMHFDEMTRWFQMTRNPCLIQQCDELSAEAAAAGVWLKREAPLAPQEVVAGQTLDQSPTTTMTDVAESGPPGALARR